MNCAKYKVPSQKNRKKVSLEKFCQDCEKDKNNCGKEVEQCLAQANLYQKFIKIC